MDVTPDPCCHHEASSQKKRWYRNKLFLTSLITAVLFLGGSVIPLLRPFQAAYWSYLRMIWWFLAVGFTMAGLIDHFIPSEYISKILARPSKRTILYSAGLGVIMSACSHGILAIAIQLHKKGASGPAIISFLLGSPWANLPITLLLVALFKIKGFLIIIAAVSVAIVTGFSFLVLDRFGWIEKNRNTLAVEPGFSIRQDFKRRLAARRLLPFPEKLRGDSRGVLQGIWSLTDMILWWVMIGMLLAALIGAYVPADFFHAYMGPDFIGILVTLAAATVIEICSEGSSILAFEIYRQTGALGNSFVFLMAGVATDYTEIGLIWTQMGWRTAVWMVLVTVPQVLLIGWIFNQFPLR